MALFVSPPPQGFSHARCSSKMLTECPARASCSPHIAPEGPPPTIAISAIIALANERDFRSGANLRAGPEDGASPANSPSKKREYHQEKSRQKYSTEERRRCRSSSYRPDNIHPAPLHRRKHRKIQRQQHHENFSTVQINNSYEQRRPQQQSKK